MVNMPNNTTLEKAQKVVRKVTPSTCNGVITQCKVGLPLCYLGKKVKVIAEEDLKDGT